MRIIIDIDDKQNEKEQSDLTNELYCSLYLNPNYEKFTEGSGIIFYFHDIQLWNKTTQAASCIFEIGYDITNDEYYIFDTYNGTNTFHVTSNIVYRLVGSTQYNKIVTIIQDYKHKLNF